MMKGLLAASIYLISMTAFASDFACPNALPTDNVNFCPSFKAAAKCHCTSSGLPDLMCQDMKSIYARMMSVFGTLQRACEYQHTTSTEDCINGWNCYRLGGVDSYGKLCNSNKKACS